MATLTPDTVSEPLHDVLHPITGASTDYDALLEQVGAARYVLLGEATHGTHEFYKARAEISKRLIRERGFTVIAWEADWPDALRVNRFIQENPAAKPHSTRRRTLNVAREERGDKDQTALEALGEFKRFPQWMWRNADVLDFVGWLRAHNERLGAHSCKVGVYGLDLYSLYSSMAAVIAYLQKIDPQAAHDARRRYACFEDFGEDPQGYGLTAGFHKSLSCEQEVIEQLKELQRKRGAFLKRDGRIAADELFYAEQNAIIAREAEHYYRAMYRGRPNTWNLRDTHMADTLDRLMTHLESRGERPKAIVWAHNSHVGDARATSMHQRGEVNVGQLLRERHGLEIFIVGFTTYSGTVTAASDWDLPAERKIVRPGMGGSIEELFHQVDIPAFLLPLGKAKQQAPQLSHDRFERAIGVIYKPETERWSHYFYTRLPSQFDAVVHFDETRAVEPLERTAEWEAAEMPETYPSAL